MQLLDGPPALQGGRRCLRELPQDVELLVSQLTRDAVDHTQRAHAGAVTETNWRAGVETNSSSTGYQWVVEETLVAPRILNLQNFILQDRMSAKRAIPRNLGNTGQADAGFEPLAIRVDQAQQGHGCSSYV